MNRIVHLLMAIGLLAASAQAPKLEPGMWWAITPGVAVDLRFQVRATPDGFVALAAPLGMTPVLWGPIAVSADGTIEFHRDGDAQQLCTLKPTGYGTYDGSCRGTSTRTLTLARVGNPGGLDIPAGDEDLRILARTRQILSGPSVWNRHDDRICDDSRGRQSWSVYCALYQATLDVTGAAQLMRPIIQETRAAIVETTHRFFQRSLLDFNNLDTTTYADVTKAFDDTERRLRTMHACVQGTDARAFPSAPDPAAKPIHYWGESIGRTVDGQPYELLNVLDPMEQRGEIPDGWVASSKSITRRAVPDDARHAIDARGSLSNGHQWRYASLCGESLRYHDVPVEVAGVFDQVIDSAYWGSKPIR